MRELLSQVQRRLDEAKTRAGDAFLKMDDAQFEDYIKNNPGAADKARQTRAAAQARQQASAQSGTTRTTSPGSSSSGGARTQPPPSGSSSSPAGGTSGGSTSGTASQPKPQSPPPPRSGSTSLATTTPKPAAGSLVGAALRRFSGPVGIALTAKDAYDQGPVTDTQREGDRQAQAGAASRFAAQRTRGERMASGEMEKAKAADDLRRGSARDDAEIAASSSVGKPEAPSGSSEGRKAEGAKLAAQPEPGFEAPKPAANTAATAAPKKETPTSFSQAFKTAREKAAAGGSPSTGSFQWTNPKTGETKSYQTNVAGEKYVPTSRQTQVDRPEPPRRPSSTPSSSSSTSSLPPEKKTEPSTAQADAMSLDPTKKKTTNEETKMSSMIEAFLKLNSKTSYNNIFSEAKKMKEATDDEVNAIIKGTPGSSKSKTDDISGAKSSKETPASSTKDSDEKPSKKPEEKNEAPKIKSTDQTMVGQDDDKTHEIEFSDKPGQKFKALGKDKDDLRSFDKISAPTKKDSEPKKPEAASSDRASDQRRYVDDPKSSTDYYRTARNAEYLKKFDDDEEHRYSQDELEKIKGKLSRDEMTPIIVRQLKPRPSVERAYRASRVNEAKGSHPDTPKEKALAALGHPKNKITHKDVLIGRGVLAKESSEGTAGAVKRDGKDVVSPTAPGGSGYKKEGPSDADRAALNKKIDKIVKEDMRRDPEDTMGAGNRLSRQNPVQRANEKDAAMKVISMKNASSGSAPESNVARMAPRAMTGGSFKAEAPSGSGNKTAPSLLNPSSREGEHAMRAGNLEVKSSLPPKKQTNEEVAFSEAELAHIAAIMEISVPASPVADDYTGSSHGVSKRDLTDETMSEEEAMKRGRGRPAGKYGSYKRKDTAGAEPEEHKAEPKNLVAQNPRTYNRDGKNMVDLEHPSKPGVKRTVPAKHYNDFRSSYLNAEKPAEKQRMHDSMVDRVFGKG